MNTRLVEEIADAVLYEGYILYPYRPSALKNQQRFNFGVVAPMEEAGGSAGGEKTLLQMQGLVRAGSGSTLGVRVRFLQLVDRSVRGLAPRDDAGRERPDAGDRRVDALVVDGKAVRGWQEAVEREVRVDMSMGDVTSGCAAEHGEWPAANETEPLLAADGRAAGAIVRRQEAVRAELDVSAELVADGLFRVTVRISNGTPPPREEPASRDGWLMRSLVSTHVILQIVGGEFLSLVDPPDHARAHAESCRQIGLWPVLVGDAADRDALLASPIILYDYPQIAAESAGDFCDGTEIDEMLALRILTMTEAEKLEMREGDERARQMLERTERLSDAHMMKLHGILRGIRSVDDGSVP